MPSNCFGDLRAVKSCWCYKVRLVRNSQQQNNETLLKNTRIFSLKELEKATNHWGSNSKIGIGGFSSVYKGTLENGSVVAIKVLQNPKAENSDFVSFITMMSVIRHRNIAQFIGYCIEGDRWIVVQEFVGEYGLDKLLFSKDIKEKGSQLNWPRRASICVGIARGLEYLHEGTSQCVVHRDIKPSNIVLDDNLNPKIVDFGIATLFDDDASHHSGNIAGTMGYMDPNYVVTGRFSEKVDVYGFGILLLEIISGKRVSHLVSLVDWAWELYEDGKILDFVDPNLSDFEEDEVKRYIEVALSCVQSSWDLRPSMSEALLMLLGGYDVSKKVLRNPKHGVRTSSFQEDYYPSPDKRSPVHVSTRLQSVEMAGSTFRGAPKWSMTRMVHRAIESDIDAHSTTSDLMEISNDLETELHLAIEENPLTGPSNRNPVKPQLSSSSLNSPSTDIHLHKEEIDPTKQTQMSQDQETELQSTEPSLSEFHSGRISNAWATSIAENDKFAPNESVDRVPYQPVTSEIREVFSSPEVSSEIQEVLLRPEIDVNRPIQCTLEKLLEALKDHRRIVLYGREGSGKTSVLKKLSRHPSVKKLFDEVIFMIVPRFSYQKFVRDEFVRLLSLNLENNFSFEDILSSIHKALRQKNFLVILDNVWEPITLPEIGILDLSSENSCWVVLGSRVLNVYHGFDSQIEMEILSNEEAWALFSSKVGNVVEFPEINPYARDISKECDRSPLIISAIGSALRGETSIEEWKFALSNIFSHNNSEHEQYSSKRCIRYCYDRLKSRDLKTGFLYCLLFQQDQEIDISMLVESFISEGLVVGPTQASYRRGHDIVRHLIKASLLEESENGIMVTMHNVIRDAALQILLSDYQLLAGLPMLEKDEDQSSKSQRSNMPGIHNFMTTGGANLKYSPSIEEWEKSTIISLMDNGLSTLPSNPNCFNLVALLLQRNNNLRVIPSSFFDKMSNLKFLNLSKTRIKSLPDSFSSLKSLRFFLLRDCERVLSLPSSIGRLKSLKVLDLQGTEITHLPDSVGDLTSLKHLKVSFYGSMNIREYKKLPPKLVSDEILPKIGLRELGMFVYPGDQRWESNASSITKEISSLKLCALEFHFPKIEDLKTFVRDSRSWINGDVTAFKFIVGPDFKRAVSSVSNDTELLYNGSQRCLKYVNGESIPIPNSVIEVLTQATSFYLDHHLKISYLSQFGIHSFNGLKICILRDCPDLERLVDSIKHEGECFPSLEYLSINYLWNLKEIWGPIGTGSFAKLRYVTINACPKLRYVLTSSMVDILINLEELIIEDCVSLNYVVMEEGALAREPLTLCSLKVLKLHYLPELIGVWKGQWTPLEYMSFYNCPKLRNLHMKGNDGVYIKEIEADLAWWDSLEWNDSELSRKLRTFVTQISIDDL